MSRRLAWLGGRGAIALQCAALLAVGVLWVAPRSASWVGSWKQALDFGAGATGLIGPVAAGAACLAHARVRRSAMGDLMMQSKLDWWRWLQPAVAVWALSCVALVAVTVGTTTIASVAGVPSYWSSAWIVLPALVVLAAQTAVGAAVGFASGRVWLAPIVVAGVFSVNLLASAQLIPQVFNTGGVTGTLAGQRFVVGPVLMPALASAGVVVVVLAAANRPVFWATWSRRCVVGLGAAALVFGWLAAPDSNDERYELLAVPPQTCAGTQPQVCVFEETPRPLRDLADRVGGQATFLVEAGVQLPDRFVQSYAGTGRDPSEGVIRLVGNEESRSTVSDDAATNTLVTPAHCAQDFGAEPPYVAMEARHLLGRWLQVRAGIRKPAARGDSDGAWLLGDGDQQTAWVRQVYRLLRTCAFEEIQMPDGLG